MSKYSLVFLVYLSSVFVCEAWVTTPFSSLTPEPYKCFEKPGNCPAITKCNLPIPIRHQGSQSCRCDSECVSNFKCCQNPCFIHKTCQINVQPSKHPNDIALERDIHAIKKLQDSETKHIVLENVVQGQAGMSDRSGPTYNVFYNVIKNIYVQNMHVYHGRHENEDNTKQIIQKLHDNIADIEAKTKDVDPHSEIVVSDPTKIPLFDDEDYFFGSGYSSGDGYVNFVEYDPQEGSGNFEDNLRHNVPVRTVKNKTLDGTDRLYFNQLDDNVYYVD